MKILLSRATRVEWTLAKLYFKSLRGVGEDELFRMAGAEQVLT